MDISILTKKAYQIALQRDAPVQEESWAAHVLADNVKDLLAELLREKSRGRLSIDKSLSLAAGLLEWK